MHPSTHTHTLWSPYQVAIGVSANFYQFMKQWQVGHCVKSFGYIKKHDTYFVALVQSSLPIIHHLKECWPCRSTINEAPLLFRDWCIHLYIDLKNCFHTTLNKLAYWQEKLIAIHLSSSPSSSSWSLHTAIPTPIFSGFRHCHSYIPLPFGKLYLFHVITLIALNQCILLVYDNYSRTLPRAVILLLPHTSVHVNTDMMSITLFRDL